MSEQLFPTQDQLGQLCEHGHRTLKQYGEEIASPQASPAAQFSVDGIPVLQGGEYHRYHFKVASEVVQRLAPEQAEILGISVDCSGMTTELDYEPLHYKVALPEEIDAAYINGGRLDICSSYPDGFDISVAHTVLYDPDSCEYQATVRNLEEYPPLGFEPEFNMRAYTAAQHVISLLPQLLRQEF